MRELGVSPEAGVRHLKFGTRVIGPCLRPPGSGGSPCAELQGAVPLGGWLTLERSGGDMFTTSLSLLSRGPLDLDWKNNAAKIRISFTIINLLGKGPSRHI